MSNTFNCLIIKSNGIFFMWIAAQSWMAHIDMHIEVLDGSKRKRKRSRKLKKVLAKCSVLGALEKKV